MQRELLELKNYTGWICECGASNRLNNDLCRECHLLRNFYPKRMNCKCGRILRNNKKGDTCGHCGKKY